MANSYRISDNTLPRPGPTSPETQPNWSVDGTRVDEHGRIWIARLANNSVDVLSEDGELLASYPVGERATNVAWWDTWLYVTLAHDHAIVRLDVGVREARV